MNDIYSIYRQIRECKSVLRKDWMWMVRYYRSFSLSTVFIYIKNIHYQEPTYSYYIQYQQYWLYYIQYIQYSLFVLVCLYIYYIQYSNYLCLYGFSSVLYIQYQQYWFVCTYIIYSIIIYSSTVSVVILLLYIVQQYRYVCTYLFVHICLYIYYIQYMLVVVQYIFQ